MRLNDLAPHLPQRAADTAAAAIGHGATLRVESTPDGKRLRVYLDGAPRTLASRLAGAEWEACTQPGRFRLVVPRRVEKRDRKQPVPSATQEST